MDVDMANKVDRVILEAYTYGIAINGDFYRYNAHAVSAAVSMGLLTTKTHEGYTRHFRPTMQGMAWVQSATIAPWAAGE